MELTKTKYKKTELGMIPVDWDIMTIEDVFKFYPTSNYSKAEMLLDGEFGCVHYGLIHAISNSNYSVENGIKYFITKEQAKYEFIKDGDVVMVDASEDLVGVNKSVELNGIGNKKLIAGLHTFLLRDSNSLLVDNLRGQILNSIAVKNQMLKLAVGMKVFGVSKVQLKQILIPVPPKEEQKAIATALSNVDDLINNLEKLIAKKKAIKQGAMQQLLTPPHKGGKRLAGYSGEWVEKKLGDIILSFQNGYGFSALGYIEIGTPIVTMAQIGLDGAFNLNISKVNRWTVEDFNSLKNYHLVNDDLIIAMTDVTPEKNLIGRMAIVKTNETLLLNQRVGLLRIDSNNVNSYFLKTLSNMRSWRSYCIGSASLGVQANIGTKDILNGKVFMPDIKEQNAIANILSEMESEIEKLEQRKSKYQSIKQGMMQELLTGKTRLV
jgi:type I restriction enzyme S subunit